MNSQPRRPPRLTLRFSDLRPFYFVTFNTHDRQPLLANPEIHAVFQDFGIRAQGHDVAVGRYVLMPDHAHLFVALPMEGITLSNWVKSLRSVIGKQLIQAGHPKPHWQEGFFDHLLRSPESYSEKWNYVHANPVRAGLCQTPEEWSYQGEIISIHW